MSAEYVDIPPEMMRKPDPDQQWIERELDRINPWRHEQGHDGADARALRQLVLELRDKQSREAQPDNGGPAFPAFEVRTHDTGDLVENASQGMTLRDYFAAHAPEAPKEWRGGDRRLSDVLAWRWWYADAMLKARVA